MNCPQFVIFGKGIQMYRYFMMIKMILFLFLLPGWAALTLNAQELIVPDRPDQEPGIQDLGLRDSLIRWEERVYLHTDRSWVLPGEALFFRAYIFNNPTGRRLSPSGVLRVEVRDAGGSAVVSQFHPIRQGTGAGALQLPETLQAGDYELVAFTRWMRNYGEGQYFRKSIRVGSPVAASMVPKAGQDLQDLRVYPEGGRLLAGVTNRLVVHAPQGDLASGEVPLTIVDEYGAEVGQVQDYSSGIGMAVLHPQVGKSYRMQLGPNSLISLPAIETDGYSLQINNLPDDRLRVVVEAVGNADRKKVLLEGTWEGQTAFVHEVSLNRQSRATLDIPKAALPAGRMTFRLRGPQEKVWAERPVWTGAARDLDISVVPEKADFRKGEEVRLAIRVTGPGGIPVQTDLSVGVRQAKESREGTSLAAYVNSNFGGAGAGDRRFRFLEDLRIQGATSPSEYPDQIRYPLQRTLELHGTAYDLENNLLADTEIQLMAMADNDVVVREARTDANGMLSLEGLEVVGETLFVFRKKSSEGQQRLVKFVPLDGPQPTGDVEEPQAVRTSALVETNAYPLEAGDAIQLEEATVEDLKPASEGMESMYGIQPRPSHVVRQDPNYPQSLLQLIMRIPGVNVVGLGTENPRIEVLRSNTSLAGANAVLWVLDGIPIGNPPPTVGPNISDDIIVNTPVGLISQSDIDRVEFLVGPEAAIYGTRGAAGVFMVYTRDGSGAPAYVREEAQLRFKGYAPPLEYTSYMKERKQKRRYRKMAPATLFWNPGVSTDANGEAVISFISPADYDRVELTAETLTPEGWMGSYQGTYIGASDQ